ncbi:MAG: hypothetical protein QM755_02165 [Luteolibacter sp.]
MASSFHPRLIAAQIVLTLAIALAGVVLCWKLGPDEYVFDCLSKVWAPGRSFEPLLGALVAAVFGPWVLLPIHPFLVGYYMRARPIFWIMLLFSLPGTVAAVILLGSILKSAIAIGLPSGGPTQLLYLLASVPLLYTIGLLLIPGPRDLARRDRERGNLG